MSRFLSPAWLAEMAGEVRGDARVAEAVAEVHLLVQQVVTATPDGDVHYVVQFDGGTVDVRPGEAGAPDLTFTQDWDTAVALSTGTLGAQEAFMQGRLVLHGDVRVVTRHQAAFEHLAAAFAGLRASTTY